MRNRKIDRYVTKQGCKVTHIRSLNLYAGKLDIEENVILETPVELRVIDWNEERGSETVLRNTTEPMRRRK